MAEAFGYNNNHRGFTLLEVMIAVLLLSLSYVAVLESFSSSMKRLSKLDARLESFFRQDNQMTGHIKFSGPSLDQEVSDGEIFLEGSTYVLTITASQGGLLHSLQLRSQ
jgi:prepilin-type N-terminal cleavage/methylation domain-containing protein